MSAPIHHDLVIIGSGSGNSLVTPELESSRTAFMERLSTIMSGTPGVQSPDTSVAAEAPPVAAEALSPFAQLSTELSLEEDAASLCQAAYDRETGQLQSVLAVAPPRKAPAVLAAVAKAHGKENAESRTAILSPDDYALLQKLLQRPTGRAGKKCIDQRLPTCRNRPIGRLGAAQTSARGWRRCWVGQRGFGAHGGIKHTK